MEILEKSISNQNIFFILLLISFLFIAVLKGFYWKFTKLLLKGVLNKRYANQYLREENVFTERVNLITFSILILNLSLFILKIKNETSLTVFLFIVLITGCFYLTKYILISFLGEVFLMKTISKLGIFFSILYDRVFGLIIFPFVVLLYFSAIPISTLLINTTLFFLFLLLGVKLFWLWQIATKSFAFPRIYIFLYLCIFEIFPLIVIGKIIFK